MPEEPDCDRHEEDLQLTNNQPQPEKILIVRCCRMPEFAAAVGMIRNLYPQSHISALTQSSYADQVSGCDVDEVISCKCRRWAITRLSPFVFRQMRRRSFDLAVVPTMDGNESFYWNVVRMMWSFGISKCLVTSPGKYRTYEGKEFTWAVVSNSASGWLTRFDVPLLFLLLLAAVVMKPFRRRKTFGRRKRILHIMGSLGAGGAQRQMAELISRTPKRDYEVHVLVLGSGDMGDFARSWIADPEVPVRFLRSWPSLIGSVWEIYQHCREQRYDLVHTWLFLANVVGAAGACLARTPAVITSVRNLSLWKRTWGSRRWYRLADILTARACDLVTVNGTSLIRDHASWAWLPMRRVAYVPNGMESSEVVVDTEDARILLRTELSLPPEAILIGTVGRLAPEKDHLTFFKMVHRLRSEYPEIRALLIGEGPQRFEEAVQIKNLGLEDVVIFLGLRHDVRRIVAGLDVFVLTSIIEGHPNALHEAVLLRTPSVSTDVGAARDILVEDGLLFEPGDFETGSRHVAALLNNPEKSTRIAEACRMRVRTEFSKGRMASRWFSLYEAVVDCDSEVTSEGLGVRQKPLSIRKG
jgi:glycosyltransferase involved in cell wall biosynthesis